MNILSAKTLHPWVLLFACILTYFSPTTLHAQRIPDDSLHALIVRGIRLSGSQEYRAAMSTFDLAIREFPAHPAGYLNKAILLQVMSLDFESPVRMPDYLNLLERAESIGERMAEHRSTEAEGWYYVGMARSYIAYYHFRDGKNWLSGLSHGLTATGFLEDCLELNPRAYEAMTGIGTYKYWKSQNMSFLTWTPLVDDERETGIKMLRRAEAKAEYTPQQATNSLIWIYVEEERWDDAITSARRILQQYPKNRLFLWGLASAAEGKEDWKTARSAYERIRDSIDDEVTEKRYIELQSRAKIALMSYRMNDLPAARSEGRWLLSRRDTSLDGLTDDAHDRIERRYGEVEEMMEEIN